MCDSLKHFRSSCPKAAHQGTGWESHRVRPQVSSSPSAQVCSSAPPRWQAQLCHCRARRQHTQVCVTTGADVWHCLCEVLQDQLLGSTNIAKTHETSNPPKLPFHCCLIHFFTPSRISNGGLKPQFLKPWARTSKPAITISCCASLST